MNDIDTPKPLNAAEVMKVFIIVDSDFPEMPMYIPHNLKDLQWALQSVFPDDEIIDDYDCDGDHHVTITHGWISKVEYESLEE